MTEKLVTPYIASQFPAHYREDYPMFVEFIRLYYGWLQQGEEAIGHARKLQEYRDIDTIPEEYILYFKNKYLPFLKFVTKTDKRTIIKHVLDLYRSKGTERGTNLFFRLVYGVPAEVYYPSTDLFRLSSNKWIKRDYLELSHNELNEQFVGKLVTGQRSKATAFAEKYVIKKIDSQYAYVLYISNIVGSFMTGERITFDGIDATDRSLPKIVGSMNELDITTSGENFSIGDVVTVNSSTGRGGKARVSRIFDTTGLVEFELIDGGWGFTEDSQVFVSEKVLGIENIVTDIAVNNPNTNIYDNTAFFFLETISQPLANLEFTMLTGSTEAVVDVASLTNYHGNGMVATSLEIMSKSFDTETTGKLLVYIISGSIVANTVYYGAANAFSINVTSYADKTATGRVVGFGDTIQASVTNATSQFKKNDVLVQYQLIDNESTSLRVSAVGTIRDVVWGGTTGTISLINTEGVFRPAANIYLSNTSGLAAPSAYLNKFSGTVGVANVTNDFVSTGNNKIFTSGWSLNGNNEQVVLGSNTVANVYSISTGRRATFSISPTLAYAEELSLNTDFIGANNVDNVAFMSLALNAVSWGFPNLPQGNLTVGAIGGIGANVGILAYLNGNVGTITKLTAINPGEDYNAAPFIYIYEPRTYGYGKRDYDLVIENVTGTFVLGEEIIQASTGGKATIKSIDGTSVKAKRVSLLTDIIAGSSVEGQSSGATGDVMDASQDNESLTIGGNALVTANVRTTNGAVAALEVLDSGLNFRSDDEATFTSDDGMRIGTAKVRLVKHGTADGVFGDDNSFLSDAKYLFDGNYYQEFSYDIRTPVPKETFEENYKQTMHLAGTKMFSTFVYEARNDVAINISLPEKTANTDIEA